MRRLCLHPEISGIVREFVHPIPREEQESIAVSVAINLYAEHGGHKRVVLARWHPGDNSSLEQFSQRCKALASEYKSVYPPNESVEVDEPEA